MRTTEEVLKQQEDDANFQRQQRPQTMTSNTALDTPFDTDTEEGSPPRELLPAGKYKAQIVDAKVGPTKNGRGTAVSLTWSISEGDYEKRLVFQSILVEHDSEDARRIGRQKFKDICSSCGITGQVTELDPLLYHDCLITLMIRKDESGQYPDKNEVRNVLPVPTLYAAPANSGTAQTLKDASTVQPAFKASEELPSDEIPF